MGLPKGVDETHHTALGSNVGLLRGSYMGSFLGFIGGSDYINDTSLTNWEENRESTN